MIYVILRGRIGNQLFQYAAARKIQIERNENDTIIIDDTDVVCNNCEDFLTKLNLPNVLYVHKHDFVTMKGLAIPRHCMSFYEWFIFKTNNMKRYKKEKKSAHFFNKCGYLVCWNGFIDFAVPAHKDIILEGYLQSEKYFEKYADDIKNNLCMDKIFEKKMNSRIFSFINKILDANAICVHIRRGDYEQTEYDVCSVKYYQQAISFYKQLYNDAIFYFFSDNIEWVRKNIGIEKAYVYVAGQKDYEDLYLMTKCKHYIMSNSSFSWWAQYLSLNPEKKVVAPSKWLNSEIPLGIYQKDWIILDV